MKKNFYYYIATLIVFTLDAYGADSGIAERPTIKTHVKEISPELMEVTFILPKGHNAVFFLTDEIFPKFSSGNLTYSDDAGSKTNFLEFHKPRKDNPNVRAVEGITIDSVSALLGDSVFVAGEGIALTAKEQIKCSGTLFAWGEGHKCVFKAAPDSPSFLRELEFLPNPGASKNIAIVYGIVDFYKTGIHLQPSDDRELPDCLNEGFIVVVEGGVRFTYLKPTDDSA